MRKEEGIKRKPAGVVVVRAVGGVRSGVGSGGVCEVVLVE